MNKRWETRVEYTGLFFDLFFAPYGNDEKAAELFCEEDGGWCYSSELLDAHSEYIGSDSLEDAKADVEKIIEDYYEDQRNYYQDLLDRFRED